MQRGRYSHTEAVYTPGGQPGVDQKHQVQAQQCQGEVDEDLRGVVSAKLPETETEVKHGGGKRKGRHNKHKHTQHCLYTEPPSVIK